MTTRINALSTLSVFGPVCLATLASTAFAVEPMVKNPDGASPDIKIEGFHPAADFTVTSGAHFTVLDVERGGCLDPHDLKDCTRFTSSKDVYLTAGNEADQLTDGRYFFTVIAPGYQNSGFRDGMNGNLSDRFAGKTAGDDGSGDMFRHRTFEVANHEIVGYKGPHELSHTSDGHTSLQLGPFDETPNLGGVYVLAICPVGVVMPDQCHYDAFRVGLGVAPGRAVVSGRSY